MSWYVLASLAYAAGGAITTWFVMFKLGPQDPRFVERWNRATAYVPGWLLVVATFLTWPVAAWNFRHGKLEPDKD